jgi:hypothetical protein
MASKRLQRAAEDKLEEADMCTIREMPAALVAAGRSIDEASELAAR